VTLVSFYHSRYEGSGEGYEREDVGVDHLLGFQHVELVDGVDTESQAGVVDEQVDIFELLWEGGRDSGNCGEILDVHGDCVDGEVGVF